MVWKERATFQGYGCSECNWEFHPPYSLLKEAETINEAMNKYEELKAKGFAVHSCSNYDKRTVG